MWFKVNFPKLALEYIAPFLRRRILNGYLHSMILPIVSLYDNWQYFRNDNLYKVSHTGQVCYLRKVLNDVLDPSLRRIYIDGSLSRKRMYLYTTGERKAKYLGVYYLYQASDYYDTGVDFNVYVPQTIFDKNIYEIKAILNAYKAGGTTYKINAL